MASSYHATSKNIRERVHGIITRRPFFCLLDPWLISLSLLPSSLYFRSFFSFFDLINQGIRGGNERISDRRNDDGGDELSSMHKERARSRVFRPRNSGRRESLIITLGIKLGGQVCQLLEGAANSWHKCNHPRWANLSVEKRLDVCCLPLDTSEDSWKWHLPAKFTCSKWKRKKKKNCIYVLDLNLYVPISRTYIHMYISWNHLWQYLNIFFTGKSTHTVKFIFIQTQPSMINFDTPSNYKSERNR